LLESPFGNANLRNFLRRKSSRRGNGTKEV
jgi:hypothetical protein